MRAIVYSCSYTVRFQYLFFIVLYYHRESWFFFVVCFAFVFLFTIKVFNRAF